MKLKETTCNIKPRKEKTHLFRARVPLGLLLILMGSIDCVTTVVGIVYFGAVECNPFLTGMVRTNLPAFVALKVFTTVFLGLLFIQANKILMKTPDKTSRVFRWTKWLLTGVYFGIVCFLTVVVVNNIIVLVNAA